MTERDVFIAALQQATPAQRQAYLEDACVGKPDLRKQVEELLRLYEGAGSFLQKSAAQSAVAEAFHDSADRFPAPEAPGSVLGPYKLLELIGEGGMGTVWMAEQSLPIRRRVAVKIVKEGQRSRQAPARLEAERQTLALMDHPNIAKVLDAGQTPAGCPYFVMELVKGQSITQYCDERRLSVQDRLDLFADVCQAVQHAHQKGIIHRDLKPSNVLVAPYDGKPVVKVIDFGVAKATGQRLTDKTLFTGFCALIGTPEYMSPEQAEINNQDIDTRSDIYSLGVLLYELLTGSSPLTRKRLKETTLLEVLRVIREEEPPRPSTRLTDSKEALPALSAQRQMEPAKLARLIRGELDWIVMKCLEKGRARRYDSAGALARDIQRFLHQEPVQAGPAGAGYRLRKFVRRNRGPVLAVSLVVLALLAGMAGTTWGLIRAERARQDLQASQLAEAQRAQGERRAKEEVQKRLVQIEKATEILASVFRDLDPEAAEREGVSARALLCRRMVAAAQELEGEAMGDPQLAARLQHVLGISLRELGHLEQAEGVLVKALQTRERLLGTDDLDTNATRHQLAVLYRAQAKFPQAEALCKKALAISSARLGPGHPDTLATQLTLAEVYHSLGNYDLAEKLYKQVLALRVAQQGVKHADTLYTKHRLALLYRNLGRFDLAEALHHENLRIRTALLGADHLDTVATKHNLAAVYLAQEKYSLAETLYNEVLPVRTAKLGADHPDTLMTRQHLALLYQAQKKYALAETLSKEVLQVRAATLGPDHPDTLGSLVELGGYYRLRGQFDRAEPLFRETANRARATLTIRHPITQTYIRNLAAFYLQQGKPQLTEPLRRELAAWFRESAGPDSPRYAAELAWLAESLCQQKKYEEAEPVAREALAIRRTKEPDHWTTYETCSFLGAALLGQKKYAEAEPFLLQGYQGMKNREAEMPISASGRLTEELQRLVHLYDAWGQPQKATQWRKTLAAETKLVPREKGKIGSKNNGR